MEERIEERKEKFFQELNQYEHLIVYGAKAVAVATVIYLECCKEYFQGDIKVAVTWKTGNPDEILNHHVYCIDELAEKKNSSIVLISTRKYQEDVIHTLSEKGFSHYVIMDTILFKDDSVSYEDVLGADSANMIKNLIRSNSISGKQIAIHMGKIRQPFTFQVQIVGHCNLNCWSCCAFSPVAKEEFMEVSVFEKDMRRMSQLVPKEKLERIVLIGGEPLLHPNLIELIKIVRMYFPTTSLNIHTNAVLLRNMSDTFFELCKNENVSFIYTQYPININYEEIKQKLENYGIGYNVFNGETEEKTLAKTLINPNGDSDVNENFVKCQCTALELRMGRLYPCSQAPSFHRLNEAFGSMIDLKDTDGVDIYQVQSFDELLECVFHPMNACRFCELWTLSYGCRKWQTSKREKEEWFVSETEMQELKEMKKSLNEFE